MLLLLVGRRRRGREQCGGEEKVVSVKNKRGTHPSKVKGLQVWLPQEHFKMYVDSWDEFARQAEALFLAEPNRTRWFNRLPCSLVPLYFLVLSISGQRGGARWLWRAGGGLFQQPQARDGVAQGM